MLYLVIWFQRLGMEVNTQWECERNCGMCCLSVPSHIFWTLCVSVHTVQYELSEECAYNMKQLKANVWAHDAAGLLRVTSSSCGGSFCYVSKHDIIADMPSEMNWTCEWHVVCSSWPDRETPNLSMFPSNEQSNITNGKKQVQCMLVQSYTVTTKLLT